MSDMMEVQRGLATCAILAAALTAALTAPISSPSSALALDCGWQDSHPAVPANPNPNSLSSVAVAGPGDAWAAGSMEFGGVILEHFYANAWHVTTGVDPAGSDGAQFTGISASGPRDAWAVGSYRAASHAWESLVEHWDGSRWSLISTPAGFDQAELGAVAARNGSDAYAVGQIRHPTNQNSGIPHGVALHWDGRSWQPLGDPGEGSLQSMTVISDDDIWAVGSTVDFTGSIKTYPVAKHWDGMTWSDRTPPGLGEGTLGSVSGVAGDVWTVGYASSGTAISREWSGGSWHDRGSPAGNGHVSLGGVAYLSASQVIAVGFVSPSNSLTDATPLESRWNGSAWETETGTPNGGYLQAVTVRNSAEAWAVGSELGGTQGRSIARRVACGAPPEVVIPTSQQPPFGYTPQPPSPTAGPSPTGGMGGAPSNSLPVVAAPVVSAPTTSPAAAPSTAPTAVASVDPTPLRAGVKGVTARPATVTAGGLAARTAGPWGVAGLLVGLATLSLLRWRRRSGRRLPG